MENKSEERNLSKEEIISRLDLLGIVSISIDGEIVYQREE